MNLRHSYFCAMKWLQIKHECGSCKTGILKIDLLGEDHLVIKEDYPMPQVKSDPDRPGNSQELALQSLDKEFFLNEMSKLLLSISAVHKANDSNYEYASSKRKAEINR